MCLCMVMIVAILWLWGYYLGTQSQGNLGLFLQDHLICVYVMCVYMCLCMVVIVVILWLWGYYLGTQSQCNLGLFLQDLFIGTDAGAQPSEGIGSTDHHGITDFTGLTALIRWVDKMGWLGIGVSEDGLVRWVIGWIERVCGSSRDSRFYGPHCIDRGVD